MTVPEENVMTTAPWVFYVWHCKVKLAQVRLCALRYNGNKADREAGYSNVRYYITQFRMHFG